MSFGSGAYEGEYSYVSRFEEGDGTNPEELIGAARAGRFSMAPAGKLSKAGHEPDRIRTTARVHLENGDVARIVLEIEADVPGIDAEAFEERARDAEENCPVSKALSGGPEIELDAMLRRPPGRLRVPARFLF